MAAASLEEEAARVLKDNCTACHGAASKLSKLDLRTRESVLTGGEKGPAVTPGNHAASRLYRFAAGLDQPSMPPGKKLAAADLDVLKRWIDAGANLPVQGVQDDKAAALAKLEERPITAAERDWWAFRKPVRAAVPSGNRPGGNAVDAFLAAAHRANGLTPSREADRRTLIRRASLNLLGLPPTPKEVEAFVQDRSPKAWENLVERLLASRHYGERWGRHWLDLVRYADSGGYEYDRDRSHAFRYRDWVVKAHNEDMPFDKFVRLQLAGDEYDASPDSLVATTYLRLGAENNVKSEQTRLDELDDVVATTVQGLLGMTVQCARCHNHKFDPIPQKDYYRIQAVFFPFKGKDVPIVPAEEQARWKAAVEAVEERVKPVRKQIMAIEKPYRDRIMDAKKDRLAPYVKLALATPPEKRTEGQRLNALQVEKTLNVLPDELDAALSAGDTARRKELLDQIKGIEQDRPAELAHAMTVEEPGSVAPPSHFLIRGATGQHGSLMKPGILSVTRTEDWRYPEPPAGATSSHRRRGFAEWVVSADNPLTSRVAVNRIWSQHFGEGLVRTPSNFGKMGERPTHPELLDWLAVEFVQSGWSVKHIQRLILNSQAYRMASDDIEANLAKDPGNRFLWRMPRKRLEAEIIRDGILAVAGSLDRTVGGPAVHPYIDPDLFQSSSKRTWPGKPDTDPSTWRRSLYVFNKRTIGYPMFEVFDKPDGMAHCARRNRSIIAPQALILMNNASVLLHAGRFAERLRKEAGPGLNDQIRLGYELALGRPPGASELARAASFADAGPNGLVDFCQALVNSNEFVFVP